MKSDSPIAFVIDSLPSLGGGEKVLFAALEAFPQAEVFTLVYNASVFVGTPLANRKITISLLNKFPFVQNYHRFLLPLMPSAIEQFDLRHYDHIVSFSYAVAHGVMNYNGARHSSYTFTPMRYAWTDLNINGRRTRNSVLIEYLLQRFRRWDKEAASRVHQFASISQTVSQRIQRAYNRQAPVIYPPVETGRFHPKPTREDFYVVISRLVPYKRIDVVVRAFNQLNLPILIVGDGPEMSRLKALAKSNIKLLGFQTDEAVADLLGSARAFVCAAEEDFGIAIVEAQAAGCPVIAYGSGGALETVEDGVTGLFFEEQTDGSLIEAVQKFERMQKSFLPHALAEHAKRFDKNVFLKRFSEFVEPGKI